MNARKGGANGAPDGDSNFRVVKLFHDPAKNSDTMARVSKGEARRIAVGMMHFDGRAKRNAPMVRFYDAYLRLTRSEEGWGSDQAANVARGQAPAAASLLDQLLGVKRNAPTDANSTPAKADDDAEVDE